LVPATLDYWAIAKIADIAKDCQLKNQNHFRHGGAETRRKTKYLPQIDAD
jgi:hypothetical protein